MQEGSLRTTKSQVRAEPTGHERSIWNFLIIMAVTFGHFMSFLWMPKLFTKHEENDGYWWLQATTYFLVRYVLEKQFTCTFSQAVHLSSWNRLYSYSRHRTGTGLQVRLMRGSLFKCKLYSTLVNDIPLHEPPLQASSSPIPRIWH